MIEKKFDSVFTLSIFPKKMKDACIQVNGITIDSGIKRATTFWKDTDNAVWTIDNILVENEDLETLRKRVHEQVDDVITQVKINLHK